MRVQGLKTEQRNETPKNNKYMCRSYGKDNDYPQKLMDIVASSGTANKCLNIYKRFVIGEKFENTEYNLIMVNDTETLDDILRLIVNDHCHFKGRCYHVNYNGAGQIVSIQHVPFEYVRLQIGEKNILTGKYLYYDDWNLRKENSINIEKVITFNSFNPENALAEMEAVGGPENYNGQLLWLSGDGKLVYPLAIYDSVISDIATEDGVATIKYRNAKNNFLPAGMLFVKTKSENDAKDSDESELSKQVASWQGDNKACKIIMIEGNYGDEKPEFTKFDVQNFDKEFSYTEESCQKNIGNVFMQPPVLRGELVAGKLGTASEIQDAYMFYNSITKEDRQILESDFELIFKYWHEPKTGFKIKELSYGGTTNRI